MIGILDMNMGNLRSVTNAVYSLGYDPKVIHDQEGLKEASHLIIPGVGAYPAAMRQLEAMNLKDAIKDFASTKRPVLGICLGMHIFSTSGEEGGGAEGLGLVPGEVLRIDTQPGLVVPHVGWNNIRFLKEHPVLEKVKDGVDFYFVHSYRYVCEDQQDAFGETEYGDAWPSVVAKDNVIGFQFHPEKSQINGLKLIENFCEWDGKC
ncbi:MAG: imidazole glycerol phosphate synthase subunit HisH [Bdellovibrionota bacterium]